MLISGLSIYINCTLHPQDLDFLQLLVTNIYHFKIFFSFNYVYVCVCVLCTCGCRHLLKALDLPRAVVIGSCELS